MLQLEQALLAQVVAALLLSVLFGALYWQLRARPFFGYWSAAWAAYAAFAGASALSIALGPARTPLKLAALLASGVAGLLQLALLAAGLEDLRRPDTGRARRLARVLVPLALLLGAGGVLATLDAPPGPVGPALRGVLRQWAAVAVYAFGAFVVVRERPRTLGARALGVCCLAGAASSAVNALTSAEVLLFRTATLPTLVPDPRLLLLADLIWQGGLAVAMALVLVDEQRSAERALDATTATLRSVLDTAPVAVFTLDARGGLVLWNAAAERLFGRLVAGEPPPRTLDGAAAPWLRAIDGEPVPATDCRVAAPQGERIVSVTAAPLRDARAHPDGAVAVVADVTALRELEARVRHTEKMEAVGRLAGGVAHDFNNLLTVILSSAQLLEERLDAGTDLLEEARAVRHAGERGAAMTRRLLAFSRRQRATPLPVDVAATLRDAEELLVRLLGERVRLRLDIAPEVPTVVLVDAGEFEQAITNLAANARDAMPGGGTLTIRVRGTDTTPHGLLEAPGAGPYVRIDVLDTGAGIAPEHLPRITEPFFTTKAPGEGTGLGLATVHAFVDRYRGQLAIQSAVGRGTIVTMWLPRTDAPPPDLPGHAERAATPAPAPRTGTVLVVEDERTVRDIASRVLRSVGYTVHTAESAEEALVLAGRLAAPADLLLTDVVLPGLNGRVLSETLAARWPGLRVLFMSGYTDDIVLREGIAANEVALLPKPFLPDQLLGAVRRVLP